MSEKQEEKTPQEPELLDQSYLDEGEGDSKRPPYLFLAFIAFVILSFIWKSFMQ